MCERPHLLDTSILVISDNLQLVPTYFSPYKMDTLYPRFARNMELFWTWEIVTLNNNVGELDPGKQIANNDSSENWPVSTEKRLQRPKGGQLDQVKVWYQEMKTFYEPNAFNAHNQSSTDLCWYCNVQMSPFFYFHKLFIVSVCIILFFWIKYLHFWTIFSVSCVLCFATT